MSFANADAFVYGDAISRMIGTLIVLVLFFVGSIIVLRWLKKRGMAPFRSGSDSPMRVLWRQPISPKTTLYLVEIGSARIVLSESHLEVRTVLEIKSQEIILSKSTET